MRRSLGCGLLSFVAFGAQDPIGVPPDAAFRTGVKLVQVSVVAQDKQGKPVADLRRDEFEVRDNGVAREIRLFLAETEKSSSSPPSVKPPNTFTNQLASPAGSHGGYSVILIDNLFMEFGDPFKEPGSANARVDALRTLLSIPLGEKIAIYALGRKLQVICEFTSDRDLLERQLGMWKPDVDTPDTSRIPDAIPGLGSRIEDQQPGHPSGDAAGEAARIDALQRSSSNNDEMDLLADHLAGIPGRKNLIWLSNRFVIGRAIQKLNRAGVSIYPVDVDGVCRMCPPRPKDLMDAIAAQTGGVAYYLRNDIDVAMREAMDDGRVSYTLGFNASSDGRAPQVHQLAVRVSRPGVTLRYRTSYQIEAPRPVSGFAATRADLAKALNGPIDAAAIPIKASVTRAQDRLNVQALLDVENLDLRPEQGLWTGKIEVVARFTTADGIVAGDVFSGTITLGLRQTTYEAAMRGGLPYRNELKIPPKAVELKLLFANLASGKIGTLAIPLSEVGVISENAK
jgi:VWFA-related protein